MKNFIKSLLVYFAFVYLALSLFGDGVVLPTEGFYFAATILILAMTVLIAEPMLKFLTVKVNFVTMFLMSSLLVIGVFFLLKLFMTGFYINEYTFSGLSLGSLEIASFVVKPTLTIISASITASLFCSIYKGLDGV